MTRSKLTEFGELGRCKDASLRSRAVDTRRLSMHRSQIANVFKFGKLIHLACVKLHAYQALRRKHACESVGCVNEDFGCFKITREVG